MYDWRSKLTKAQINNMALANRAAYWDTLGGDTRGRGDTEPSKESMAAWVEVTQNMLDTATTVGLIVEDQQIPLDDAVSEFEPTMRVMIDVEDRRYGLRLALGQGYKERHGKMVMHYLETIMRKGAEMTVRAALKDQRERNGLDF
jgi:hypothetical protein